MEKYFCTYDQSLFLKELGFDEKCLGYYESTYGKDKIIIDNSRSITNSNFSKIFNIGLENERFRLCAPLKSQAFNFFREKYNIHAWIDSSHCNNLGEKRNIRYMPVIDIFSQINNLTLGYYDDHSEAENDCVNKSIEIIKKLEIINFNIKV